MKTLTTNSFEIAYETYLHNMGKLVLFDYRFIWSEMAFRYVVKYRI